MTPFFVIDSKYSFAARVNREIAEQYNGVTFQEVYNADRVAFPSDGLVGKQIPNTTINYEDATSVQYLIALNFLEGGDSFPTDMQQTMDDCAGPVVFQNYSYSNWGLGGKTPLLPLVHVISQADATEIVGFVKP